MASKNKIIVEGINFLYDDLEINQDVMEKIDDFIYSLKGSPEEDYDNFYMYMDGDNLVIYWYFRKEKQQSWLFTTAEFFYLKFLLKSSLMALFIKLRTIDAQKAVPKLPMDAVETSLKAIWSTTAFTTRENKPKVTTVIGKDKTFRIGFIVKFTSEKIIAIATKALVFWKYILLNIKSNK